MVKRRVSSGSPFEATVGFSRAVRVGDTVYVSGTAPIAPDGSTSSPGDAYGQTRRCLEIIREAVEGAGGELSGVVRTRMFLTDRQIWEDVARAHGEYFGEIRPAATMVVVAGLLHEDWLVEIEAECRLDA